MQAHVLDGDGVEAHLERALKQPASGRVGDAHGLQQRKRTVEARIRAADDPIGEASRAAVGAAVPLVASGAEDLVKLRLHVEQKHEADLQPDERG